ncbi:retinol dehydrogenase 13-like [Anoplophora glabripennis]|uniref:retinol dehydrogenase 13-like n=1 Tax=Anoplophora glabripennis TaxID=217634 RepID=UPI000873B540|nr:retinol dehydrogenase 13-like [Anoplophora glabripennis]
MWMLLALTLFFIWPLAILKITFLLMHRDCKSKVCLVGKTALVTGGSRGIGYEIVLALAQRGCRVIVANRTIDEHLLEDIHNKTRSRNVVLKYVDMISLKSVKELANDVIKNEGKLDILVNNAGIGSNVSATTEDGLDLTMQVNYFSTFLLTQLLEELLKKSRGRIIFTSSLTSYLHNFTIDRLKSDGTEKSNFFSYPNSKLCLIMISEAFAKRLKEYGVTSNVYHPGLVDTEVFQRSINLKRRITYSWFIIKLLQSLAVLVGKTAEEGAQTAIHLACANEVENVTGEYFFETEPTLKPKLALDKKMCDAVWEATEEILKSKL